MTAQDQMRKMLDQLMGQDRDGGNQHANLRFTDKEVCRPFLLDICINELFTNTRADLGDCNKIHSLALRAEYEKASANRDYEFEEEVLQYLQSFIKDNERKIELAKKRLEMQEKNPELEAKAQVVHELGVQIGEKVAKSEALGAEGKVDESLAVLAEVESLKTKKKEAEDDYRNSVPFNAQQQQQLRACEVCGAFLSLYDNDRRLADHFGGKLHMGYVTIRERIKLLEEVVEEKAKTRRARLEERRDRKDRSDSKETRKRSRSRSRERRRRSRSRDRDRRRDKDRRSRSRERMNSSKDSRRDRSRSRERRRDREQDRKRSRSRSRERRQSRS